jgi:hypothetical protein
MPRVIHAATAVLAIGLCLLQGGCRTGPELDDVLPGSDSFQIDRWDVAVLVTRAPGSSDRVQIDLAIQEVDELGRPAGSGVESRRDSFTVGKPFIWERSAATSDRTLQIVAPNSRRLGREIEVELTVIAREGPMVMKSRTRSYVIR